MNNQVYYQQGGGDEQYTPKYGVEVLLPHIQHLKDKIIWCPFDREDSQFVKVLTENEFKIIYSHIDYGQDFLTYEPEKWDIIIGNPPYISDNKLLDIYKNIGFKYAKGQFDIFWLFYENAFGKSKNKVETARTSYL